MKGNDRLGETQLHEGNFLLLLYYIFKFQFQCDFKCTTGRTKKKEKIYIHTCIKPRDAPAQRQRFFFLSVVVVVVQFFVVSLNLIQTNTVDIVMNLHTMVDPHFEVR